MPRWTLKGPRPQKATPPKRLLRRSAAPSGDERARTVEDHLGHAARTVDPRVSMDSLVSGGSLDHSGGPRPLPAPGGEGGSAEGARAIDGMSREALRSSYTPYRPSPSMAVGLGFNVGSWATAVCTSGESVISSQMVFMACSWSRV